MGPDVDRPDVALDAYGNGVVVWQSSDGSSSVIRAATRTAAGSWSKPPALSSCGHSERPHVGIDSAGDTFAVWSLNGAHIRAQAAVRPAGGSWSQPATLSDPAAATLQPQVAFNPRGDAVAAWASFDGRPTSSRARAVRAAASGAAPKRSRRGVLKRTPGAGQRVSPSPEGVVYDAL